MREGLVELTPVGKEKLARLQRVLERFQSETRCESSELEQLRRALRRHIELRCAAPAAGTGTDGVVR